MAGELVAIMSLVWPEGWATKNPTEFPPGIYFAASRDGVTFREPVLLHKCDSHARRAYDLPVQGNVSFTESGIEFNVHQNVPCRMADRDRHLKEKLERHEKELPGYMRRLWSQG